MNSKLHLRHTSQQLALLACVLMSFLAITLGLLFGSVEHPEWSLIVDLRLPRVLAAFAVGALLATAGNLLQTYTRNPLAEPSILGISSGASVGALLALIFGFAVWMGAWAGALLLIGLLWWLAGGFTGSTSRLILAGVMLGTACGSIISVILMLTPDHVLPGMLHWLMGDLQGAMDWISSLLALLFAALLVLVLSTQASNIQLLPLGDDKVASLGVPIKRLRWIILLASSLAIAVSVAIAGTIGFVGLFVPHFLRLISPHSLAVHQRWMIPACALVGGIFLVLADLISRIILAPSEIPVGVVTAVLGVPLFLYLLTREDVWGRR
jgi:iron complex transport system permease protein